MLDQTKSILDGVIRLGDNTLVLGQRLSAWCGHAPALEEDIALANTALDLVGQATLWLDLAAELEGKGRSADEFAFLRDTRKFQNALLVEQPNGDYGKTLMRQFLFDAWHAPMLELLAGSNNERIAAVAEKSAKEAAYHLERSADLVVRLGDGTQISHQHMQDALDMLWPFAGELIDFDETDITFMSAVGIDYDGVEQEYTSYTSRILNAGTLTIPIDEAVRKGGKIGLHSEEFGPFIAEMQWLQRAYPGATW